MKKNIFGFIFILGMLFPVLSFASINPPIEGLTCSVTSPAYINENILWESTFDNSSSTVDYQFYWTQIAGDDSITSEESSFTTSFSTLGTKTFSLDVYGSDDSVGNQTCTVEVVEKISTTTATTTATTTPEVPPTRTGGGGRTGQVAGVSTTTATTTTPVGQVLGASTRFIFNMNLGYGMSNDDVKELQERLTEEGVYSGPITGYFGDLTLAAVKLYQAKHGISQTGFLGPLTRGALNNGQVLGLSTMSFAEFIKMLIEIGAIYGDKATLLKTIFGF
jgi:hypothetical protein